MTFFAVVLLYPCMLAALCLGTGLLVDRVAGGYLPGPLLPAVGLAGLVAVSQLVTFAAPGTAPAVPGLLAAAALAGGVAGRRRLLAAIRAPGGWLLPALTLVLAYVLALAPVLLAGRPTFSSYDALTDSALHVLGADYLAQHGQQYAGLDTHTSAGVYLDNYYAHSYPSGADVLLGETARPLGVSLLWVFQPFCAFLLATATGPALVLARRIGLRGTWSVAAAVSMTLPALVYGYELVGSVKELAALVALLTAGALVAVRADWLKSRARAGLPFALATGAGVADLGLAFGVWAVAAVLVLGVELLRIVAAAPGHGRRAAALVGGVMATTALTAVAVVGGLRGAFGVATAIATTANPGNLKHSLDPAQVAGVWLAGSYRRPPVGVAHTLTIAFVALVGVAAVCGLVALLRRREHAVAGWIVLLLAAGTAAELTTTTWASAKTLMLSSPVVLLLAWAAVAALGTGRRRLLGAALALTLVAGVAVSDAMQYHGADLAPTTRYDELARIDTRFAGGGPALFTDFDEYALYLLRDVGIGAANFSFQPAELAGLATSHGARLDLDRVPLRTQRRFPLVVTRVDPTASRPSSAYAPVWRGRFYEVWRRRPHAAAVLAHLRLAAARVVACPRVRVLARIAARHHGHLVASVPARLVRLSVRRAQSAAWPYTHGVRFLARPGRLTMTFSLRTGGPRLVWLAGEMMPAFTLRVDGRLLARIHSQLSGNIANPDTIGPYPVRLLPGTHHLTLTRSAVGLGPGDAGSAFVRRVFMTPAGAGARARLQTLAPARWRRLCGRRLDWLEATPPPRPAPAARRPRSVPAGRPSAQASVIVGARTVRVLRPDRALGMALDGHEAPDSRLLYRPAPVRAMRADGLRAVSLRLRTELGAVAWHWNPTGTWSDPVHHQGYWTSSARVGAPIDVSYGYDVPRRGDTHDQAEDNGYCSLDDGDLRAFWKSDPYLDGRGTAQWAMLDFGRHRAIDAVRIHWGTPWATRFAVQWWQGDVAFNMAGHPPGRWRPFPRSAFRGHGGSQTLRVGAVAGGVRFLRVLLLRSSHTAPRGARDRRDALGYAIRELQAGTLRGGRLADAVVHGRSAGRQTNALVSSTDPWHRASDLDRSYQQPGFDAVLRSGVSRGRPLMVPVADLYGTPADAVAEARWLRARHVPLRGLELGEEPDGQGAQPEDDAALYALFARAITAATPGVPLGGPSLETQVPDWPAWPDHHGDRSWVHRFVLALRADRALGLLHFFTFEWYPFDDGCRRPQAQLDRAPGMLQRQLALLRAHGVPRGLPIAVTELGYSAFATRWEVDLPGAILDAEATAQIVSSGPATSYLYGPEPASLQAELPCGTWGNLTLWLAGARDAPRQPTAALWAARLLTTRWTMPGDRVHRVLPATVTGSPRVGAYAVGRPDGRTAVLLVNRDLGRAARVAVTLPGGAARRLDVWTLSAATYRFHPLGAAGFARPDRPPAHTQTSRAATLPPASVAVVVGGAR